MSPSDAPQVDTRTEWEVIEVCLGCGKPTAGRDCGCPAGTGWTRQTKPKVDTRTEVVLLREWTRHSTGCPSHWPAVGVLYDAQRCICGLATAEANIRALVAERDQKDAELADMRSDIGALVKERETAEARVRDLEAQLTARTKPAPHAARLKWSHGDRSQLLDMALWQTWRAGEWRIYQGRPDGVFVYRLIAPGGESRDFQYLNDAKRAALSATPGETV